MEKDWDVMMECFKTYRDTTDTNHFISSRYVMPSIATFPSHLHGLKLGSFLQRARKAFHNGNLTPFQVDALMQYQIHWYYELYKLEFVSLPALDAYKENFGYYVRVPVDPSLFCHSIRSKMARKLMGNKISRPN